MGVAGRCVASVISFGLWCAAVAEILLWAGTWLLSGVEMLLRIPNMGVAIKSDATEDDPREDSDCGCQPQPGA